MSEIDLAVENVQLKRQVEELREIKKMLQVMNFSESLKDVVRKVISIENCLMVMKDRQDRQGAYGLALVIAIGHVDAIKRDYGIVL